MPFHHDHRYEVTGQERSVEYQPDGFVFRMDPLTQVIKQNSQDEVSRYFNHTVRYAVIFLSEEIRDDHHQSITDEGSPGRPHITREVMIGRTGDPQNVQYDGHDTTSNGNIGAVHGLVSQFIPDGQIIVKPQKQMRQHQDGDDCAPFPEISADKEDHYILEVKHRDEEQHGHGNDEVSHDGSIRLPGIFFFGIREKEGFGRIPVCLDEECHEDRDLVTGAVDPHLCFRNAGREQVTQQDPVEGFVGDTRQPCKKKGQGIDEHPLPHDFIHPGIESFNLGDQQENDGNAGNEVGDENIFNAPFRGINEPEKMIVKARFRVLHQPGTEENEEEVQRYIQNNVDEFDRSKPDGPVESAEFGKRDGRKNIKADNQGKPNNILRMIGILDPSRHRIGKDKGKKQKNGGGNQQGKKTGTENLVFTLFFLGEPEEGCFHSIRQDDQQ